MLNVKTRLLHPALHLFLLSFIALFLELTLIRWVPSIIRLVAYYSNLLLISSFLGLGLGAMLAHYRRNLFARFPAILALNIGYLLICQWGTMPGSSAEARFFHF